MRLKSTNLHLPGCWLIRIILCRVIVCPSHGRWRSPMKQWGRFRSAAAVRWLDSLWFVSATDVWWCWRWSGWGWTRSHHWGPDHRLETVATLWKMFIINLFNLLICNVTNVLKFTCTWGCCKGLKTCLESNHSLLLHGMSLTYCNGPILKWNYITTWSTLLLWNESYGTVPDGEAFLDLNEAGVLFQSNKKIFIYLFIALLCQTTCCRSLILRWQCLESCCSSNFRSWRMESWCCWKLSPDSC